MLVIISFYGSNELLVYLTLGKFTGGTSPRPIATPSSFYILYH